jgi:hypothetical protein
MGGIFISYRRDDSDVAAGRLADDLSAIFGAASIFRDVDSLHPGQDYEKALDSALDSCAVLLAVIGPRWATITDKEGQRRLENPTDWVCAEISRALVRDIQVIPVLISGTTMPRDPEVPSSLKPLLKRQGFDLDDRLWKHELAVLAQVLEKIPGMTSRASLPAATGQVKRNGIVGLAQVVWSKPMRTQVRYVGASVAVAFLLLIGCVVAINGILRRSVNISGTWKIESQNDVVAPLCAFKQVGNDLTGSCTGPNAVGAVTGMIEGNQLRWTWQWRAYVDGTAGQHGFTSTLVSDNTINGKVERAGGPSFDFKATR